MPKAKDAAERTPFERMSEFAGKIVRVPKLDIPKPGKKRVRPKRHSKTRG